ncbi:nicotinamide-nucleotide adenylyltransferase [Tardisphaera miroshnichenkoae]
MKKYKKGIIIGRFQPFHLGHLKAVEYASSLCERLVIGIGSAQESGTIRNPFDADTREVMIRESLKDAGLDLKTIEFLKIPDFMDDEKWFNYIVQRVPDIEVVFSGNGWVRRIFKARGIKVVVPPWYNRGEISGTKVRQLIRSDQKWEGLVPRAVISIINQHRSDLIGSPADLSQQ